MKAIQILLLVLSFSGPTGAVYKRWIPNTNFENVSNWAEQRPPCSQDKVVFAGSQKVSVFVGSEHPLRSLYLPLDGEFILSPGAGFMAASAGDPSCGEGSLVNFGDVDRSHWSDPTLWQSAASTDDLENGRFVFAVDTERVPCHHDDVVFSPGTSFRVRVPGPASDTRLRSLSVLGRRFSVGAEFGEYLASRTGGLQFPGPAQPQVTGMKCQDQTGCLCGNERMRLEICSALLQHSGNKCPDAPCANPLQPVGHCCGICGAVISLDYTAEFDLEVYRSRLIHSFLSLDKYSEVKLAVSKVQPLASAMGEDPLGSEPKIQIVCIDEKTEAGMSAMELAHDIMEDIESHGRSFGIAKAEMAVSTGGISSSSRKGSLSAGSIAGIILSIVLVVSLLGLACFLYRKDAFRLATSRFFWFQRNITRLEESGGFSNPNFDLPTETEEIRYEDFGPTVVEFSNPIFDGNLEV